MALITTSNGHRITSRTIIALAFIILIGTVFAFDDDSVSTASAGHGLDSDGMSGETSSEEQQQQLTSGDYKFQMFPEDEEEKAEDMFAIDIWEDWLKKRRLHNQQQRQQQQQRHRPSSPQLSIFHQATAAAARNHAKPMTKRGPSCMMKCLSQGYLHPAQCHSLC